MEGYITYFIFSYVSAVCKQKQKFQGLFALSHSFGVQICKSDERLMLLRSFRLSAFILLRSGDFSSLQANGFPTYFPTDFKASKPLLIKQQMAFFSARFPCSSALVKYLFLSRPLSCCFALHFSVRAPLPRSIQTFPFLTSTIVSFSGSFQFLSIVTLKVIDIRVCIPFCESIEVPFQCLTTSTISFQYLNSSILFASN